MIIDDYYDDDDHDYDYDYNYDNYVVLLVLMIIECFFIESFFNHETKCIS